MNFQRGRYKEEPEINLVPLIYVMMVILIFLMITTTYSKYTELQINLPTADAEKQLDLSRVAREFLRKIKGNPPVRFDIVSVYLESGQPDIELFRDAFALA